jgi:hypothetical protein
MPKTFTVHLPIATERTLKYTSAERMEFEKRFRFFNLPGMQGIILEKVFPQKPNPNNDNKPEYTGDGDMEAQNVLIWLGLRHIGKHITEEKVTAWLDLAVTEGRSRPHFIAAAVNAVIASGVLGYVQPEPAVVEEEVAEGTGGKEPTSGQPSESSTAT